MRRKVVILGLDGVSQSLLHRFSMQGIMPCFRELIRSGSFQKMETSLPEVSSVAWTSFMTGKNPGEHGIYGFMDLRPGSYEIYFPNYNDVKQPVFWESAAVPSVILNIPQTYPARPLNGVMTSGFVSLDLRKATYPDSAYQYLNTSGYKMDVNVALAKSDPQAFFRDLAQTFERRMDAILHFFDTEAWEIFIGTITETDRLHHFFYESAEESGAYYREFVQFYRRLDAFIGTMHQKALKENALFITCSDHGFTPIKTEVYLNQWLMQEGYLEVGNPEKGVETMAPTSRAFCLDPSRIYLHRSGRYPKGSVSDANYHSVRNELKQKLSALSFQGERVVRKVFLKEDLFTGPYTERGPDLYVLPEYGFDLKGTMMKKTVFGTSHFKGMHTQDDAHFFVSDKCSSEVLNIEGIAALVHDYLKRK